jgi:hypothetical protein
MSAALIIQLLATFGPSAIQLIDTLIAKVNANGVVTPDEWNAIRTAAQQSSKDRMRLQLQSAGIDPTSPQGVTMLALA